MIVERVEFAVFTGREHAFELAMQTASKLLSSAEGCSAVTLARGVERPSCYLLQLQWRSIDDHTAFTKTSAFAAFREQVGSFFAQRPSMEHFDPVNLRE